MMRALFTLLPLCAAALFSEPASEIGGRVIDPSGAPVAGARVSVTERVTHTRGSAVSDDSGSFQIRNLPEGDYLVEAAADGLQTPRPETVRVDPGAKVRRDFRVEVARLSSQVQVTAAAIAQTVDEQSKALDVIDTQQLASRAEYSAAEALRTVPGVRVMQFGGPGSFTRILMRGTRAADTSILIDGIRLRDAASPQGDATALLSDLLLSNTARLEVLRGSGSSLYGTHATGGVVNMITDTGGGFRGELGAEGGGLGTFLGRARFSGTAAQNRLNFAGGVTALHVSDGVDGDDRARNSSGNVFASWQAGANTTVTGRLMAADAFAALNDNPFPAPAAALPAGEIVRAIPGATYTAALNDPDQRRWATTVSALAGLQHVWSPRASGRISYALVKTGRDNRDGPAGQRYEPMFPDRNVFDGRIDTVQARGDLQIDRRRLLTAGYEYERESYDNVSSDENPDAAQRVNARLRIAQASHAAFAQAQGRYFDDRLQVLVSGRVQRFALGLPRFSDNNPLYRNAPIQTPPDARTGDVSVSYTIPTTSTKIRAHAGNGYRAPSLFERFGASFFFGSFSAYGDPRLGPERVLAFDGGFDQYFAGSRLRVSSTYFYTRVQEAIVFDIEGLIVPDTDPYSRWGGYRNTGGGLSRGLEFTVEAAPARSTTLQGSYTFTKAQERKSPYGNSILRSVRVSEHMFTATASQRIGRAFDLAVDVFAAGDSLAPLGSRAFRFEGPVKADLVASYTAPVNDRHSVRIYTRVENALNRRYYEEGFPTPRAWAVAGIKWMF